MLRPQDTATRERKSLDGPVALPPSTRGGGPVGAVVRRPAAGRRRDGGAGQLQRHRRRRRGARPLRRRLVPDHRPGAARLGRPSGSCCTSSRPPTGPPCGSTTPRSSRHEGGYTPFEADVTEHVRAGRRGAGHRRGEQHAELPDHPAGRHRGHPGRQAAALLARLLQLRRPAPVGLAVRDPAAASRPTSPSSTGLDGADRHRRVRGRGRRRRRRARSGSCCATPTGAEVAAATGRERHADRAGRRTAGRPGDGYLYDLEVQLVDDGGTLRRQLPPERRRPHRRRRRHPVPHQRRAVPLHRLRQARGPRRASARATTTRSWCTTSRCWTGSARTPSAPRTTRTPRTSSTTPTATASSSSTRPPPSG